MNDRMYELINQCFIGTTDGKLSDLNTVANVEKFAELIIRECMDVIKKEVSMKYKDGGEETEDFMDGHYAASVLARVKIKQHFGVK